MKEESLSRFMKDLAVDRERNPAAAQADRWDPAQEGGIVDEEEEDDDELDVNIVDRSTCVVLPSVPCLPQATCRRYLSSSTAPSPHLPPAFFPHPFFVL